MKLYIAGKVSKESQFGTHHWRDAFVTELSKLSGIELSHLDPLAYETAAYDPQEIFDKDCWLISQSDCVVVYLSDDISVGGSQEMLIAKYLGKPLIGYAPRGGKFNADRREFMGQVIKNYVDPFVYASCDVIAGTLEEVAEGLKSCPQLSPKDITIVDEGIEQYERRSKKDE